MTRSRTTILTLLLVLLPVLAAAQSNPCTTPVTQLVLNPSKTVANLPEHTTNELDGSPRVTDYQVAYFTLGADPATAKPILGPFTVAKTAWTLVAGTTDCYESAIPGTVPVGGTATVAAIKARRAATATVPAAESPWSSVSNPFGTAPTALVAPGLRVVR